MDDDGFESDFSDTDTIVSDIESSIFVSICQIYNESISDLLGPGQNLKFKMDSKHNYYIDGLS